MTEKAQGKIPRFIGEVVEQMKKVTWPTKDELIGYTMVVAVISLIITVYVGAIDFGCKWIVELLVKIGTAGRA